MQMVGYADRELVTKMGHKTRKVCTLEVGEGGCRISLG